MPPAPIAQIAAMPHLPRQLDQRRSAEFLGQLPAAGLVDSHERRAEDEPALNAEFGAHPPKGEAVIAAIEMAGTASLAHAADGTPMTGSRKPSF